MNARTPVLSFLLALVLSAPSATQDLSMPGSCGAPIGDVPFCAALLLYEGLSYYRQARSELDDVYEAAGQALAGENVTVGVRDDWRELVVVFERSAELVREAAITPVDPSRYAVSLDDFRYCSSRPAVMELLNAYQSDLENTAVRAAELHQFLIDHFNNADMTGAILKELSEMNEQLTATPFFGEYFQWDFYAVEVHVRPALNRLKSALSRKAEKIVDEPSGLGFQAENLQRNLAVLQEADCVPDDGGL